MEFRRSWLNQLSLKQKILIAAALSCVKLAGLYGVVIAIQLAKLSPNQSVLWISGAFSVALVLTILSAALIGRASLAPLVRAKDYLNRLIAGDTNFQVRAGGEGRVADLFHTIAELRVTTEKANAGLQMIENVPTAVMVADPKDEFKINYLNASSSEVLKKIEHLLPVPPSELLGKSVDIFHENPSHQRKILSDPNKLPYSTIISLGEEKIRLKINAIMSLSGDYVGPMLCWDVITKQDKIEREFDANVNGMVEQLSEAFVNMKAQMEQLGRDAQAAVAVSRSVSEAADITSSNVETVAAASEELSSSVREISEQMSRSTQMANEASALSTDASKKAEGLSEAADKISEVITMISTIAEQTNLLALNATIEAARAGDAGKGFAVVASEVKTLAKQTAKATNDIQMQIESVQGIASGTVDAVKLVTRQMEQMNQIFASVAAAVEQQSAATLEISGNAQKAATGTQQVTQQISEVHESGQRSSEAAGKTLEATEELSQINEGLRHAAASFLKSVQDAAA